MLRMNGPLDSSDSLCFHLTGRGFVDRAGDLVADILESLAAFGPLRKPDSFRLECLKDSSLEDTCSIYKVLRFTEALERLRAEHRIVGSAFVASNYRQKYKLGDFWWWVSFEYPELELGSSTHSREEPNQEWCLSVLLRDHDSLASPETRRALVSELVRSLTTRLAPASGFVTSYPYWKICGGCQFTKEGLANAYNRELVFERFRWWDPSTDRLQALFDVSWGIYLDSGKADRARKDGLLSSFLSWRSPTLVESTHRVTELPHGGVFLELTDDVGDVSHFSAVWSDRSHPYPHLYGWLRREFQRRKLLG